jgi:hypothetical protein
VPPQQDAHISICARLRATLADQSMSFCSYTCWRGFGLRKDARGIQLRAHGHDELERPNTVDIQRRTGIPTRSLGRDLGYLREAGVIEFVGAPQTGFYRRK